MKFLCNLMGHRLKTSAHSSEATLWCERCKRVVWFYHEASGLILDANATQADLVKIGVEALAAVSAPPTETATKIDAVK